MTDAELYRQFQAEKAAKAAQDKPSDAQLYADFLASKGTKSLQTEDVMHPDISTKDRTIVKAFGNDVGSSMRYLQRNYPHLNFRENNGDIQAQTQGEPWKKLDPSGFDIRDISDLAYDIPAGIAQGVATGAAGVAGAAGGGVGAIPAAMAGSAASGAGLEAIRQGLGKYFGVNDEVSGKDVAIAGGVGAVSPLLFGTGAGAKEIAKAGINSATQRGLVGRGYDATAGYLGPKIGAMASNIPEPILETAAKILPKIKQADSSPEPITQLLEQTSGKVTTGLKKLSEQTGRELDESLETMAKQGVTIPTQNVVAPIYGLIEKLKTEGVQTEERKQMVKGLEDLIQKNFMVKTVIEPDLTKLPPGQQMAIKAGLEKAPKAVEQFALPENLTPKQAKEFYFTMKGLADDAGVKFDNIGSAQGATAGANMGDTRVKNALFEAMQGTQESIKQAADTLELPGKAPGQRFGEYFRGLHDDYSTIMDEKKEFQRASKSDEAFQRLLTKGQTDATTERMILNLQDQTGVDLADAGKQINAMRMFRRPTGQAKSLQGATSTSTTLSRQIPLAAFGGAAGYYAGQQSGGEYSPFLAAVLGGAAGARLASPAGLRMYMTANQAVRNAPKAAPQFTNALPQAAQQIVDPAIRAQMWTPHVLMNQINKP